MVGGGNFSLAFPFAGVGIGIGNDEASGPTETQRGKPETPGLQFSDESAETETEQPLFGQGGLAV